MPASEDEFDAVIVGAGFSGLASAIELQKKGFQRLVLLEKAPGVGGTWHYNAYPGAACDIPAPFYSLSTQLNPNWSRLYAPQGEILAYMKSTAAKLGLDAKTRFNTRVVAASWEEGSGDASGPMGGTSHWRVTIVRTSPEDAAPTSPPVTLRARFFVSGPGALSTPSLPRLPGAEHFKGEMWHSARWRHDVPLAGKRVVLVGTGASAAQIVPAIAPLVGHLTVIQRTPAWVVPRGDFAFSRWSKAAFRWIPGLLLLYRFFLFLVHDVRYFAFIGPILGLRKVAEGVSKMHLRRCVPNDPKLRAALTPTYPMGCKRVIASDDFWPALTRPNVAFVSSPGGLKGFNAAGELQTAAGTSHAADVLIWATGFDIAMALAGMTITGRGGRVLMEEWTARGGPDAYLGCTVPGFPNLFMCMGPNTGLGHSSMITHIEAEARYCADIAARIRDGGWSAAEVKPEVHAAFNAAIQARLTGSVWSACNSWYIVNGKNATLFPGTVTEYLLRCWVAGKLTAGRDYTWRK